MTSNDLKNFDLMWFVGTNEFMIVGTMNYNHDSQLIHFMRFMIVDVLMCITMKTFMCIIDCR